MTMRSLTYTLGRPKVLVPGVIGAALLLADVSLFWGLGFLAFSLLQTSRLLSSAGLDDTLRLRADKERHHIGRLLTDPERHEIFAIDAYAKKLRQSGVEATLALAAMDKAWEIIRDAGGHDASDRLRMFRHSLPPLDGASHEQAADLPSRIAREVQLMDAARKEVESLAAVDEPQIKSIAG